MIMDLEDKEWYNRRENVQRVAYRISIVVNNAGY